MAFFKNCWAKRGSCRTLSKLFCAFLNLSNFRLFRLSLLFFIVLFQGFALTFLFGLTFSFTFNRSQIETLHLVFRINFKLTTTPGSLLYRGCLASKPDFQDPVTTFSFAINFATLFYHIFTSLAFDQYCDITAKEIWSLKEHRYTKKYYHNTVDVNSTHQSFRPIGE